MQLSLKGEKATERFLPEPVLSWAEAFEMTKGRREMKGRCAAGVADATPATGLGDVVTDRKSTVDLFFHFGIFHLLIT